MNPIFDELKNHIEDRTARLAVIGLGYVGLPMAIEFVRAGYSVVGIDTDSNRIEKLKQGKSYILDVGENMLRDCGERLNATNDFSALMDAEVVVICVPTPLRKTKDPDLSYILSATQEISKFLHKGQLVILESTTYPGTTEEIILPGLQATGLKAGGDFFVAFSPERIDPGNPKYTIHNTPKIVGGVTEACGILTELLYRSIVEKVVRVSTARSAEMVKLLENTFRAINIGMVNEVAIMCDKLGIDTWEVIDAAATKPFGFMPFYPGPGLGGHCIPIDPHYLSWKLKTLNYSAKFIELAGEINSNMPHYVVNKISNALNDFGKSIKSSKILLLGAAYKKNSNDYRESPALDIWKLLEEKHARILYHDPYVPVLPVDSQSLKSEPLSAALLESMDCSVIVTDHSNFDWQFILSHSRLIVDTRNATRGAKKTGCVIVKL
jgi:UDP-N-acetyl-D-glucosamine dehydrogenase